LDWSAISMGAAQSAGLAFGGDESHSDAAD